MPRRSRAGASRHLSHAASWIRTDGTLVSHTQKVAATQSAPPLSPRLELHDPKVGASVHADETEVGHGRVPSLKVEDQGLE